MNPELSELYRAEAELCLRTLEGLLEKGASRAAEAFAGAAMSLRACAKLVGLASVSDLAGALAVSVRSSSAGAATDAELAQAVAVLRRIALSEPGSGAAGEAASRVAQSLKERSSPTDEQSGEGISWEASEPGPRQAMTDLFFAEVETHSYALAQGLLALERNPADTGPLEAMMRAAHSLKGAARVTGLDAAVRLGHVMEDCFVAAQQGRITLGSDSIDALLQGVDPFAQLSEERPHPIQPWLAQREKEIAEILTRLERVRDGLQTDPVAPASPPEPPLPGRAAQPASGAWPQSDPGGTATPWSLFQAELRAHVSTLQSGLLVFEHEGISAAALEGLIRSAQSLRGAAGVIRFEPVLRVVQALQTALLSFRGKGGLESGQVDLLLRAVDFLDKSAAQSETDARASLDQTNQSAETIARDLSPLSRSTGPSGAHAPAPPLLAPSRDPRKPPRGEQPSSLRDIRITSEKLDRLLGISGEAVVLSGHQEAASATLRRLKGHLTETLDILNKLRSETANAAAARVLIDALWERALDSSLLQNQWMEEFDAFTRRGTRLTGELHRDVLATRMRPFADATKAFPRMVRDLAKGLGKRVRLEVCGPDTEVDRDILEKLDAPLTHIVRNAVDHGMESPEERKRLGKSSEGSVVLDAQHRSGRLIVSVRDDGRGIDPERVREKIQERGLTAAENAARMAPDELFEFLFLPGFSTAARVTEVSGRGVGLDVVQSMVQDVGGSVRVESALGEGTSFILHLPLTRSVLRTLLIEVGGEPVAVPLSRIDRAFVISKADVQSLEGRQYVSTEGGNLGLVSAYQLLGFRERETPEQMNVVVLSDQRDRYGLVVGRFLGEQDVVVRPVDPRIGKIQDVAAIGVLHDGSPAIILDIDDVVRSVGQILGRGRLRRVAEVAAATRAKRILVADDSVTVREVVRSVLVRGGYAVELAVDGMDAWNAIRSGNYQLLITDIDMPRLTGFELLSLVRGDVRVSALPVLIVSYKDSEEDRLRGLEAGGNLYFSKSEFEEDTILDAVKSLIGAPR